MINIRASNNKVVAFNRDVLILFSNLVRSILRELPCCGSSVTPVILLPGISASVLIKLQDILNQGYCDETLDVQESSQLLDAATSLGLDIRKFYIGKEKKSTAVKEALVNLDNVKSNSKEIKSIIEQKQREGSQVVLIKTSKAIGNLPTIEKPSLLPTSMMPPSTPTQVSQPSPRQTPEPNFSSQPATAPSGQRANEEEESSNQQHVLKTAPLSATKSSSSAAKSSSTSSMVSPLTIPVKQERREVEVASAKTTNPPPEPMEEDQPRRQSPPTTAPAAQQQSTTPTTTGLSAVDQNAALEYKCEVKNCNKPFSTVILLKYHYCSHFMSMLKKNHEHLLDNSNSCKDCKKNFQNSRRLLLHIGVNHDKINEILRSRGYKELPAHSASLLQQAVATKAAEKAAAAEKSVFDVRKILDVKNVPLIPTPRKTSEKDITTKESSSTLSSSSSGTSPSLSSSEASKTVSTAPPGPLPSSDSAATSPSPPAQNKEKEANCNYELECQVCKQQMNSLNQLEQHCCRHFMKELAEQFSSLMDDLRCSLCNTVFKQKHKLLLHIGCKHGKINDILKKKGFAVLPAPVLSTTNHAMQKQLVKIKKERVDKENEGGDTDLDFGKEEKSRPKTRHLSSSSTASNSSQASSAPAFNPGPFSTELSEILKKYSNLTQAPTV